MTAKGRSDGRPAASSVSASMTRADAPIATTPSVSHPLVCCSKLRRALLATRGSGAWCPQSAPAEGRPRQNDAILQKLFSGFRVAPASSESLEVAFIISQRRRYDECDPGSRLRKWRYQWRNSVGSKGNSPPLDIIPVDIISTIMREYCWAGQSARLNGESAGWGPLIRAGGFDQGGYDCSRSGEVAAIWPNREQLESTMFPIGLDG